MNLPLILDQLENAQPLRPWVEAEPAFAFRHALTQESAYESLLHTQRRGIHRAVAQTYEQVYPDRCAGDLAAILAHHYSEAGDTAKALDYDIFAGDAAARTFSNSEAILHYSHAIEHAENISPRRPGLVQNLYLKLGRIYELDSKYAQALARYEEMETLARAGSDRAMELAALIARTTIYSTLTGHADASRAKTLSQQALALARALGDQPSEAKIPWNLFLVNAHVEGNVREGLALGEQGIAIARALNLQEQLAYLLSDTSSFYVDEGDPERAALYRHQAREIWRALNNLPMLADGLTQAIAWHLWLEYTRAAEVSREALEISRSIGNRWNECASQAFAGRAYRELGLIEQAIASMQEAVRLGENSFQMALAVTRADLGVLYGDLGQIGRGLEFAQLARVYGERFGHDLRLSTASQLVHLYLLNNDIDSPQIVADRALIRSGLDIEFSMRHAAVFVVHAELCLAQGDLEQAIQTSDRLIDHLRSRRLRAQLSEVLYLKRPRFASPGKTGYRDGMLGRRATRGGRNRLALDAVARPGRARRNRIGWEQCKSGQRIARPGARDP